jgi:hypothetical protein
MPHPSESLAAEALTRLLTEAGCVVRRVPISDPKTFPDLRLTVDDRLWAVEETQLRQYVELGKKPRPESAQTYRAAWEQMCGRIQRQVQALPRNGYWISIFVPVRSPSPGVIERRALAYIRSGATGRAVLDDDGLVTIRARPTHAESSVTYAVELAASVRAADGRSFDGLVTANVEYAIKRALEDKLLRFRHQSGYGRRVLVLSKAYIHVDTDEVKHVLARQRLTANDLDAVLLLYREDDIFVSDAGMVFNHAGDLHVVATPGEWNLPLQSCRHRGQE